MLYPLILYPLIDAAFDSSDWHLSQVGFRNHDAIMLYNDLEKHFEGRDAKDVLYHTINLHRFTAQPKEFDIKEDTVRLDDLFREVDEVTGTPLSDVYKLSYFMCHFQSDPRPGVATRIATLDFTGCNYIDMFRTIYDLSVVAPVHLQHLEALTKTPKTKKEKSNEICRNLQKGLCKYPDSRYKHVLETAPGTKTQAASPVTPPKKSLPSKTAYPAYITSEHRRQIGSPAGVVSYTNPTGISRKQMYALKVFDRAGALDSSSTDTDPLDMLPALPVLTIPIYSCLDKCPRPHLRRLPLPHRPSLILRKTTCLLPDLSTSRAIRSLLLSSTWVPPMNFLTCMILI
jgi:hypothetical protein